LLYPAELPEQLACLLACHII